LHKADYAVGKLWQTIQNTPGLANDTIMIIAPEHGRNLAPNSVVDNFGFLALDHTSDATSREIFLMIVGPSDKVKQNQVISQNTGESIDIVPTINRILGYDQWVNSGVLQGRFLNEAFLV
jgi:arylsulfatase A-like enzyme